MKKPMRGEAVTYTMEEIQSNINTLLDELDRKKNERKALNKTIREINKQIEYWQNFDESQYKMF